MKGITLVELLAVIVIIAIISIITVPILTGVINENKQKLYDIQIEKIKTAASDWAIENISLLPTVSNESLEITLDMLKEGKYIQNDVVDPLTDEDFNPATRIIITYINNNYEYEVIPVINDGYQSDLLGPTINLNGQSIIYLDLNSNYTELGASANKDGQDVDVYTQYMLNNKEVSYIDTSISNTYTVVYSSTITNGESYTSYVLRTVIVRE